MTTRQERIDAYIEAEKKGLLAAFLWAFLFGPLGMFYVSATTGAVSLIVGVLIGLAAWPVLFLLWIFLAVIAPVMADAHNKKLRARAELMASGD